jgi:hypothetical protein
VKVLLDENVPIQVLAVLERVARDHEFHHVDQIEWKSKKDKFLLADAAAKGYQAIVTNDISQLNDPSETQAIRQSQMHHIRFEQDEGIVGYAHAVGSIIAAMPGVMQELAAADGQRLVRITKLERRRRHTTTDPSVDPPTYWGRRAKRRPSPSVRGRKTVQNDVRR